MEKKLIKIPLQFFGEDPDDFEDNFEDDFEDDFDEDPEDEDKDLGDGDDAEADGDGAADPEDAEQDTGDPADDDTDKGTSSGEGDKDSDIIAELKALGYVGDDLAALASDMKTKREAKEQSDKSKARRADLEASKGHVRSSKPGQSVSGTANSGFTERQVSELSSNTGCSKDRARKLLAKHHRLLNGG